MSAPHNSNFICQQWSLNHLFLFSKARGSDIAPRCHTACRVRCVSLAGLLLRSLSCCLVAYFVAALRSVSCSLASNSLCITLHCFLAFRSNLWEVVFDTKITWYNTRKYRCYKQNFCHKVNFSKINISTK